ncbi:MAG: HIT family protein [Alphaproteobacteria bacterium]|nr:HIT family protein [Alphaproteobacteria bacterium]
MTFELVAGLAAKDYVTDLPLCRVLFENNKYYPWIFLVPRKENTKNMTNLTMDERIELMREIALAENVMLRLFPSDQDNVAMIGNMTPQLHVHIVCRKKGDPDWPGTVWNNASAPYDENTKKETIAKIKAAIEAEMLLPQYQITSTKG